MQEKLRLAKEKKDVENLKQAGLCFNCRNMLQGGANHVVHTRELLGVCSMVAMQLQKLITEETSFPFPSQSPSVDFYPQIIHQICLQVRLKYSR